MTGSSGGVIESVDFFSHSLKKVDFLRTERFSKLVLMVFTLSILSVDGSSQNFGQGSYTQEYGSTWNPQVNTASGVKFVGCGGEHIDNNLPPGSPPDVKIPRDLPCGLGTHEIDLLTNHPDGYQNEDTAELTVEAFNMNPNVGDYLVLRLFGGSYEKTRDMYFTNDDWKDGDVYNRLVEDNSEDPTIPDGAFFLVTSEYGRAGANDFRTGVIAGVYGNIYQPDSSFRPTTYSLPSTNTFDDPDEGWWNEDEGGQASWIWDVTEEQFDSGKTIEYGKKYNGCITGTDAPYDANTKYSFDSCSPVHENGKWKPDGEIIVATDPSKGDYATSNYDDWRRSSKTDFFICRGDFMGSNPEESKIVERRWITDSIDTYYYRCADGTNEPRGDWVLAECPPGEEIQELTPGTWGCDDVPGTTINVNMFKVENVPESDQGGPIVAGFNVSEQEINKFEDKLGDSMDDIEAECWMGDDNERPASGNEEQSVRITYNYPGAGTAWVLGEIPWRSSLNTNTYSCIYGFTANLDNSDTNLLESTRNSPLQSVEADRKTINHSKIEQKYDDHNTYIDENSGSTRDIWDKYSGDDERPNVDSIEEDMFSYADSFPYCNPPPSSTNIFDHIMCS